jgi:hypothetical protein
VFCVLMDILLTLAEFCFHVYNVLHVCVCRYHVSISDDFGKYPFIYMYGVIVHST